MRPQKSKSPMRWFFFLQGVLLAAVVIVGLVFIFRSVPRQVQPGQVAVSSPIETRQPTNPAPSTEIFPTPLTEAEILMTLLPPTETPAPMPTLTPTPVVTPIPLAQPPYIPDLPQTSQNYTLLLRDGQVLRALDRESGTERVVVDISAQTSLLLAERQDRVMPFAWGAASPAGDKVALVLVDRSTTKGVFSRFSIHLLDVKTGELELLVEDGQLPAWSPDGGRIAYRARIIQENPGVLVDGTPFSTDRLLTEELRVVDVATKITTTLFTVTPETQNTVAAIHWSPVGDRIAFVKTQYLTTGATLIVPADGHGDVIELTPVDSYSATMNWSADGKQIVILAYPVLIVDLDTGDRKQLTHMQFMTLYAEPVWITDTPWLTFSGTKWFEYETNPSPDIWIIDVQDGTLQRLTQTKEASLRPKWVPNTNKLLFSQQDVGIWELDLYSGERHQIYHEDKEYLVIPQIQP